MQLILPSATAVAESVRFLGAPKFCEKNVGTLESVIVTCTQVAQTGTLLPFPDRDVAGHVPPFNAVPGGEHTDTVTPGTLEPKLSSAAPAIAAVVIEVGVWPF
jgi:hypothetical protein